MAKTEMLGVKELAAAFRALDDSMRRKTAVRMVVAAGRVVRHGAKAIAQQKGVRRTGSMIKNIAVKREKAAPPDSVQFNVGVRHGRHLTAKKKEKVRLAVNTGGRIVKRYEDDPYYYRFIELDTKYRARTPFLAESMETNRTAALDAQIEVLNEELEKAQRA